MVGFSGPRMMRARLGYTLHPKCADSNSGAGREQGFSVMCFKCCGTRTSADQRGVLGLSQRDLRWAACHSVDTEKPGGRESVACYPFRWRLEGLRDRAPEGQVAFSLERPPDRLRRRRDVVLAAARLRRAPISRIARPRSRRWRRPAFADRQISAQARGRSRCDPWPC